MSADQELEEDDADADPSAGDGKARVKRKMAIVIGFIGTRYRGLMINPEVEQSAAKKSVEELIRVALVKANIVSELNSQKLEQKVKWSRSSRTDAGVSALRLVISARLLVSLESLDQDFSPELVDEINEGLPADIRCFSAKKVPNSFDAKHACSWREYEYILPTQLAQPLEGDSTLSAEVLAERLQGIMQRFEGCHSFHNFTRLKASDCLPRAEREKGGDGKSKGRGKGKKGKGEGKGKHKRGKKRKAEALEEALDAALPTSEVGDGDGPGDSDQPLEALEGEATVENESPKEDADAPMPEAVAQSGTKVSGAWVEVCSKDETSGWRHRPAHVLKHTQSTMHMMTVEPALGGKLLRIVLRGQFFLYNQIRLMVGTAVAIVAGVLPEELLEAALVLTTEMHMPLAPATGLLLRTAGFSRLDERAGCCAMDPQQAREVMLPSNGFVLMDEKAATASTDFVRAVEMDMDLQWTQSKEAESWRSKLRFLRPPSGDVMEELRAMKEKALKENADLRVSQDARDSKRREAQLASLGEKSHVGLLPRRFAAACMVRFRLVPGWRLNNIQSALTARMREWHREPSALPEGMSMPPETQELLDYCTAVGIEELADEGAKL